MNPYDYLLSNLSTLKGIGKKTANLFKKKILIQFLICCGYHQKVLLIEVI